jgi:hypothetical protein
MTTLELRRRVTELLVTIESAANDLRMLRDSPEYDEDYKIEQWGHQLTPEQFDRVYALADELCEAVTPLMIRGREMPAKE